MEDDEIVININRKKNNTKKANNSTNKKTNNKSKKSQRKVSSKSIKKSTSSKKGEARTYSNTKKRNLLPLKIFAILILLIGLIAFLLCSSLFNIKNISVSGNNKLSENKIISLSSLEIDTNMFRYNKSEIAKKIKENAYIESVKISRKLPSTIKIDIEEREATYMLQFADSYVYINNQGYMLDISNEKLDIPILVGFTTDLSNIKAGNRINVEDLKKMKMVIEIYETARANELNELITKIDISNPKNYTIALEKEGKTVYLGDGTELNPRMLCLKSILEVNKGVPGEIFLNVDLNSERVYFRKST